MRLELEKIAKEGEEKFEENLAFRNFLKEQEGNQIDELVFRFNEQLSATIDCTACGNCCKELMINLEEDDVARLCAGTGKTKTDFIKDYVEQSAAGSMMVMNTIPCKFLADKKCTIYAHRPQECRNFPGLHIAGFQTRMFATFMHYGRCPIIYRVIEKLKIATGFRNIE